MQNIKITLSVAQLREADACEKGIEYFKKLFGEEAEIIWNPLNELLVRKDPELKNYLQWLIMHKLIPSFSFDGINLEGTDLKLINFESISLCNANLSGTDLSHAYCADVNFRTANLSCANLYCAILRTTDLSYTNLYKTNLQYADLRGANLNFADLFGVDLTEAILDGATFEDACYDKETKFPKYFKIPATMRLLE